MNVDRALQVHGDRVNTYIRALRMGDPLADAFANDCTEIGKKQGMRLLDEAVARGAVDDDAPESLRALVSAVTAKPFWYDVDQIEFGARAYSRYAREAGLALGTASLVAGYSNAAATRPLAVTMRFKNEAKVRALETSMWVVATTSPGGLKPGGLGYSRTIRVRMIHAFVRQHILRNLEWDVEELGIPINQADMAFTSVEFSLLPIRAMQQLGVHFSRDELAGMYALWRYMGFVIGVDDSVLPTNQHECERLEQLQRMVSPPPDDYCREFVSALLNDVLARDLEIASGLLGYVGRRHGRDLLHGLSRSFVGDKVADGLGIDNTAWKYTPLVTRPALAVKSRVVAAIPALRERQLRRSVTEVDAVLADTAQSLGLSHDLVDQATGHPSSR